MSTVPKKTAPHPLDLKTERKLHLQQEFHWPKEAKVPMLCLPLGMTEALGGKLLEEALPGILSLQVQLVILGKGSADYGALFTKLEKEESHRVKILPNTDANLETMLTASDMALFFHEPDASDLKTCLRFGVVPVSMESEILEDYNPVQETGNSFTYRKLDVWNAYGALVRACETFKFPYDWRTIQKHCLKDEEQAE